MILRIYSKYNNNNMINLNIFGFEATKHFYEFNVDKFKNYDNIKIYNVAVGNENNNDCKLYTWGNQYGNTIYSNYKAKAGRPNKAKYEVVAMIRLSDFIKNNNIDIDNSINILKMNIEGAEIDVMKNLYETNLIGKISLFLTIDYFKDVDKVNKRAELDDILNKCKINYSNYNNRNKALEKCDEIIFSSLSN